ncbi:hypothetical protein DNK63_21725 [Providencia rettgeri]|nr:hypothetical protein DNK63_21725 [Providencia rettgeri]
MSHFSASFWVNDFFRRVPALQRACIEEMRKEARAEAKLLESAATRILLECTLPLLDDELSLCLSPSGGAWRKINSTVAENDATRLAARESNRKASFELNNVKRLIRGCSRRELASLPFAPRVSVKRRRGWCCRIEPGSMPGLSRCAKKGNKSP